MTESQPADKSLRVLVTGATGYIGGRLAPRLVDAGHRVRAMARNPDKISDVPWAVDVDVVCADLTDQDSLDDACRNIDVIYYLVHSMGGRGEFIESERRSAENLAAAARRGGVGRVVYLGGLHPESDRLSTHLRSRSQVGEILLNSGVSTIVLQAGVVIGSGSASFEMIRHLTNRLPVMTTPRWVNNRIQPIAVRDVLYYLLAAATVELPRSRVYDIGGPDVLRYGEMMHIYADVAGLARRRILVLPVLTPKLAGLWIGLVTPVPPRIGRALIESLSTDAVAGENDIDAIIPPPPGGVTTYRDAVALALRRIETGEVETTWANASPTGTPADLLPSDPSWAGDVIYTDDRSIDCEATIEQVWQVVEGVGGENGWYSFPLAWTIRGWLDRLTGGVGLARGRRHPHVLHTGDALDFWRVERIQRPHLLRLRAEMRTPGRAWLEWRLESRGTYVTRLHQRAIFFPKGSAGRLYWYSLLPFHGIIFTGMINNMTVAARGGSNLRTSTGRRPQRRRRCSYRSLGVHMIEMQRQLITNSTPASVFAYLADFTTTEQWDPGTVRTVRIAGDGGVGTRYANTSRFAGRTSDLVYAVTSLTPGQSIELRGENASVIAHDTITVTAHPRGCLVTYRVRFAFRGWLRWAEPVLRLAVTDLLDKGVQGLRRELARI